jgi:hypothetical protein
MMNTYPVAIDALQHTMIMTVVDCNDEDVTWVVPASWMLLEWVVVNVLIEI